MTDDLDYQNQVSDYRLSTMNTVDGIAVVPPHVLLSQVLTQRGYDSRHILHSKGSRDVSNKQILDYNSNIIGAIRNQDMESLQILHSSGSSMSACNRFSESIVHLACRRSSKEVVDFLLSHGGDVNIADDFGRNPLHDACWRAEPAFDIVTLLLEKNKDLLRCCDSRGATPLHYVRQVHWKQWCAYLLSVLDRFWPKKE